MKTRNTIAILAALAVMAGLTGCKSDDELTARPAREMLRVLGGDIEIRSGDETTVVSVSADCHWRVQDLDAGDFGSALTVQPREGIGDGTLVVGTDQNTTKANRTASFTLISDGGLRQRVTVTQTGSGDGMNLSRGSFSFEAVPAEAQPLVITSNTGWRIEVPDGAGWLHLDKTSGSAGAEMVQLTADPAVTDAVRTTTLVVLYGSDKSAEVTVTQEGMTDIRLSAPEQLGRFNAEGGQQVLPVECNAQWVAYIPSSVTWLHFGTTVDSTGVSHDGSGIGDGELSIRCDRNTSESDRLTAIVIVSGSKNPQQRIVLVEQAGTGRPEAQTTVGDLTSLYVADSLAEFRFSFVSDDEVEDYGLVYSPTGGTPTRDNAEVLTVGSGGTSRNVLAALNGLQPSTTYYVRAFVVRHSGGQNVVYSPNVVTITTSASPLVPGDSDNPDPSLAPRR